MNLVDAQRQKAAILAEAVASRLDFSGLWEGYSARESLQGELRTKDMLTYWRPGQPQACLVFFDPVMHDIKEVNWGEEVILQKDVLERFTEPIELDEGAVFDDTVSHTFSKTTSLLEAAKVGAELAIKASASAEYAGVKGGLEVAAKISAEYSRQWGNQETQTDTVSRHLTITGPWYGVYEAVRSLTKTQREISARTDFEFSRVGFIDETGAGVNPPRIFLNWASMIEFLAVAQGIASADKPGYQEFMQKPLPENLVSTLKGPSDEVVKWLVEYDNNISQDIKARKNGG